MLWCDQFPHRTGWHTLALRTGRTNSFAASLLNLVSGHGSYDISLLEAHVLARFSSVPGEHFCVPPTLRHSSVRNALSECCDHGTTCSRCKQPGIYAYSKSVTTHTHTHTQKLHQPVLRSLDYSWLFRHNGTANAVEETEML